MSLRRRSGIPQPRAFSTSVGPGRYRANTAGDSQISVNYGRLSASREVDHRSDWHVPCHRARHRIRCPFPISGARVQARDSSGNGPSTESDGSGFFRLFGVAPDSEIVVSRAGYSRKHAPRHHRQAFDVNFEMNLNGPRPRVDGTYTVTLESERMQR
jgi:hypothetical protein